MRTRAERRKNTQKKYKKRLKIAKNFGLSFKHKERLKKTGWACSCYLCQKDDTKRKLEEKHSKKEIEQGLNEFKNN